ncbi:MAG: SAM-dependent chlorinase/fluorinase [Deltaproteobacteria bacterium]|nr:MAG: SAM-dependent chlorinase/fluorinase [Deltaproteobacteria bacterium]
MLITLTTDFGQKDSFVGIMKGVIAGINPQAHIIDISHGIPPQDILAGALTLRHAVRYFPRGSIHVAVIDPGVGSARRPLLIEWDGNYFIGPDNGVLSLAGENVEPTHIVHLSNPAYHLKRTGTTFHGRDIFAPAAAHLSVGVSPMALGEALGNFVKLALPEVARQDRSIEGEIVYIDSFGNLFTNIREHDLTGLPRNKLDIVVRSVTIRGLSQNYASAGVGEFLAVINSWDMLEIAAYKDNAQKRIGAKIGDRVEIALAI